MPRKPVNNYTNKGYITPPIPPEDDFVYFCVPCPNEPQHIENLLGAIQTLTKWTNYKRTDDKRGKQIADIWRDIWLNLTYTIDPCFHELDECAFLHNSTPRITWFPEDPYHPGEEIPDGYTYHPWTVVSNSIIDSIISLFGFGFKVGDVFTDLTKIPIATWLPDFIDNLGNLPSFTINDLVGTGVVKIHFLNIPQGGRALIQVDDAFDILHLEIVELSKDFLIPTTYPPETQVPIIVEVPIEIEGTHNIKVTFLPTVDVGLSIPLFFGGGLRAIEICGFGETTMTDPCCPDEIAQQQTTNDRLQKIINLLEGGMTADIRFNGGTTPPDTTAGDCAPVFFDHDDGETDPEILGQREKALCITCERYVKAVLLTALQEMGTPAVLVDWVGSQIPQTVPLSLSKLTVVYPSFLEGLAAFFDALSGGMELEAIVCRMIAALSGDMNNTFTNFKNSLSDLTDDPAALLVPLIGLVSTTNGVKNNYMAFNEALEQANDEDLDAYTCPCEEVVPEYCGEPLELEVWGGEFGGSATVITLVAPDIYHITNSTAEAGTYYAAIKDAAGKCLKFEIPDGYTYQPVQSYYSRGCCDDSDGTAIPGDFSGNEFEGVQWNAVGDVAIDTYVKITCQDCCEEIELEDGEGTGCSIIYMGECIYRFNNTTPTMVGEDEIFYFSFRAVDGSCLHVENSDNPDFPTQGVGTDTNTIDCDDVPHSFTGGFTPSDLKSAKWFGSALQKPTYFKITLA